MLEGTLLPGWNPLVGAAAVARGSERRLLGVGRPPQGSTPFKKVSPMIESSLKITLVARMLERI